MSSCFTISLITSIMCSAISSFLRMMSSNDDEELFSVRKKWDGWTSVWPSASNRAFQKHSGKYVLLTPVFTVNWLGSGIYYNVATLTVYIIVR